MTQSQVKFSCKCRLHGLCDYTSAARQVGTGFVLFVYRDTWDLRGCLLSPEQDRANVNERVHFCCCCVMSMQRMIVSLKSVDDRRELVMLGMPIDWGLYISILSIVSIAHVGSALQDPQLAAPTLLSFDYRGSFFTRVSMCQLLCLSSDRWVAYNNFIV